MQSKSKKSKLRVKSKAKKKSSLFNLTRMPNGQIIRSGNLVVEKTKTGRTSPFVVKDIYANAKGEKFFHKQDPSTGKNSGNSLEVNHYIKINKREYLKSKKIVPLTHAE